MIYTTVKISPSINQWIIWTISFPKVPCWSMWVQNYLMHTISGTSDFISVQILLSIKWLNMISLLVIRSPKLLIIWKVMKVPSYQMFAACSHLSSFILFSFPILHQIQLDWHQISCCSFNWEVLYWYFSFGSTLMYRSY